jgi:hypothetical protein
VLQAVGVVLQVAAAGGGGGVACGGGDDSGGGSGGGGQGGRLVGSQRWVGELGSRTFLFYENVFTER